MLNLGYGVGVEVTKCVLWSKSKYRHGYGRRWYKGREWSAHRAAWDEAYGPIPTIMLVCHKCDIKACVNPNHLFLGTQKDNLHDRFIKHRKPQQCQLHNNWYVDKHGHHHCRDCHNKWKRNYRKF